MANPNLSQADQTHLAELEQRAEEAFKNEQWNKVIELCTEILEYDPNVATIYCNRSVAHRKNGDYDKAIADCDTAINLDTRSKTAYNYKGLAYYDKKEYAKAIKEFDQATMLDGNYTEAYCNRGIAYLSLEKFDESIINLNRALELNPNYVQAYISLGLVYDSKGDHTRAITNYNKVIDIDDTNAEAYNNRAISYSSIGDYDNAIANHNRAIELRPNLASAYLNRGNTYFQMKNYNLARLDFNHVLKIDPTNQIAFVRLGYMESFIEHNAKIKKSVDEVITQQVKEVKEQSNVIQDTNYEKLEKEYNLNMCIKGWLERFATALFLGWSTMVFLIVFSIWISQQSSWIGTFIESIISENFVTINSNHKPQQNTKSTYTITIVSPRYGHCQCKQDRCTRTNSCKKNNCTTTNLCESYCKCEISLPNQHNGSEPSPFSFFPLIIIASFLVFPFLWLVRNIRHDRIKYWILREDSRTKKILTAMIKHARGEEKDAILELYNHYNQHHSADLIVDEQKKETTNFTLIERLKNVIDRQENK